jgi:hypothetical protein
MPTPCHIGEQFIAMQHRKAQRGIQPDFPDFPAKNSGKLERKICSG